MNWKQVSHVPSTTSGSTVANQTLPRTQWPGWALNVFSGAWFTPVDGSAAQSTAALSTGSVLALVDFERIAPKSPTYRYYRSMFAEIVDGRMFHIGNIKDLDFPHHNNARPPCLLSPSTATTT